MERGNLWQSFIFNKYGSDLNGWNCNPMVSSNLINLENILSKYSLFTPLILALCLVIGVESGFGKIFEGVINFSWRLFFQDYSHLISKGFCGV